MEASQQGVGAAVDRPRERNARRSHPLLAVWAFTTIVLFGISALWSFATPIDATNDEGPQVLKAVSVVRGQIVGTPLTPARARTLPKRQLVAFTGCEHWVRYVHLDGGPNTCAAPFTIVTVPQSFSNFAGAQNCNSLAVYPDTCPAHLDGSNRPVEAVTYVGRYPPLYYAIVGLPSLVSQTNAAVYAMRLVSGLLTAVLLGLAIALVATWSSRPLLLVAVTVAATPMVLVFGSTVNPSGLEMSAALCTWAGVLILVLEHAERPPPGLVAACTASAVVMAFTRSLSPLWLVLIAVFVVALRPVAVRSLAADQRVRTGFVAVVAASVLAVVYVLWAHSLSVVPTQTVVSPDASLSEIVQTALGQVSNWIYDFTGSFGWALANPPLAAVAVVVLAVCAVALAGFVTARRGQVIVLAALIVTALALPVAIIVSQVHKDGIVWQARDGFPLYCGVILVAGAIAVLPGTADASSRGAQMNRVVRHLVIIVAGCVAFAQFADLMWALRRFTVGLEGPLNFFGHSPGAFSPPVSSVLIVLTALGLCGTYGWWIVRLCGRMPSAGVVHDRPLLASDPGWTESEGSGDLAPADGATTTVGASRP